MFITLILQRIELADDINADITVSLHGLSEDELTAATDLLQCRRKKFVNSAVDPLSRGHVCKHPGIQVLLLPCVLLLQ